MWASSRAADGVAGADRERLHAEAHLALVGGDVVDLRAQQAPVQLGGGAGGDRRCGQPLRRWPCRAWPMPLAVTGRVAAWIQSWQNRARSALLFRYREVPGAALSGRDEFAPAKACRRLSAVLTPKEVARLPIPGAGTTGPILWLPYGTGMPITPVLDRRRLGVASPLAARRLAVATPGLPPTPG